MDKKSSSDHTDRTMEMDVGELSGLSGSALPLPRNQKLFVEILEGSEKGKVLELSSGRSIIGRSDADLVIREKGVSKKHAVIEAFARNNIHIRDLASTNGTYVNGVRISQRKITSGDIIKVGSVSLKFLSKESAE